MSSFPKFFWFKFEQGGMTFVKPCSHVLFKSESHHGVFMTQNSVSDLPGGSVGQGGSLQGAELAQCQKEGAEAYS